jgi:hypothetical protein
MHVGPVQQQMLAVQKEALVRIEGQGAQTERLTDAVEDLPVGGAQESPQRDTDRDL